MSATGDTTELKPAGRYPEVVFRRPRSPFRRAYEAWNNAELFTAPPRAEWSLALRRVRTVGFALLLLEFVGMGVWSYIQSNRFVLTPDFGNYYQAVHQIANGVFNPMDSIQPATGTDHPVHFWTNAVELFVLPIAALYRIYPHAVTVKWVQNLGMVASQAIAFAWMCDIAARHEQDHPSRRTAPLLAVFGLLLLVGNPWFTWAGTVDVHGEPFTLPFAIGTARDLHRGRRSAWWWAIAGIFSTGIGATYIAAVGISAALSGRVRLKRAAWITLAAVVWFGLLSKLHLLVVGGPITFSAIITGGKGIQNQPINLGIPHPAAHGLKTAVSTTVTYGQIFKAAVEHPLNIFRALWVSHNNLWATVSAAGIVGLLWIPALVPALVVLLEGGFYRGFSLPGFQNIAAGVFIAVGTVAIGAKMLSSEQVRVKRWITLCGALIALYVIGWFVVWIPNLPKQWLNVSPAAARVLQRLQSEIGPNDEVVADHGFAGAFANREWSYAWTLSSDIFEVKHGREVWIILSPNQGIEEADSASTMAVITELDHNPAMHPVASQAGIWAFKWNPPKGTTSLKLTRPAVLNISGGVAAGSSGVVRAKKVHAAPRRLSSASSGAPGYVVSGGYFRVLPGRYKAVVSVSASRLTNVELWDSTRNVLLSRVVLSRTHGIQRVALTASVRKTIGQPTIQGWGPWKIDPIESPGDDLEVRVWTAGGTGTVRVYRVTMEQLAS